MVRCCRVRGETQGEDEKEDESENESEDGEMRTRKLKIWMNKLGREKFDEAAFVRRDSEEGG